MIRTISVVINGSQLHSRHVRCKNCCGDDRNLYYPFNGGHIKTAEQQTIIQQYGD